MARICIECGGTASRLRKERCNACYMRLYRGGEIPEGAACQTCGERRKRILVNQELSGESIILCGNCALFLSRLRPPPDGIAVLKRKIARERRAAIDRRVAAKTVHVPERRAKQRRTSDKGRAGSRFDPAQD